MFRGILTVSLLIYLCGLTVHVTASNPSRRHVISIQEGSGRVVEAYNADFIIGLRKDARERYSNQVEQDRENDRFTPNVLNSMRFTEHTILGETRLGALIYSGRTSSVYQIRGHPDLLIKYEAHCSEMDTKLHPMLSEFWYGNETHSHGLGPRMLFVSPPSLLCESKDGKCDFTISDKSYSDCKNKQGTLRYLIMERVAGMSVHEYRGTVKRHGALPFHHALIIGYQMIALIEKLHTEAKLVHGDLHSANIMIRFTNTSTGSFELLLIDLGYSFKIPDGKYSEEPEVSRVGFIHELRTLWQMDGYESSQRDDVLKIIQSIAHIMHPYTYLNMEQDIRKRGIGELRKWKQTGNWFIPDSAGMDPLNYVAISYEAKHNIRSFLEEILKIGREMKINEPVPYARIKSLLVQCFNELTKPSRIAIPSST